MSGPTLVFAILLAVVVAGAVGVVLWGMRSGRATKAPAKGQAARPAKAPAKALSKAAPPPAKAKPARPTQQQTSALERKYVSAKKRFNKTIDKRILREPIIGERLRRNRDMVLGWYEQKGKVEKMRYQAGDARSACKVCQGRHGKEYGLLETDVVARILPPSHADVGGKKECNCQIMPVMAGEP